VEYLRFWGYFSIFTLCNKLKVDVLLMIGSAGSLRVHFIIIFPILQKV